MEFKYVFTNEKEKGAGERAKKFFSRLFAGSGNADDINLSDVSTRTLDEKTKKNILEKAKSAAHSGDEQYSADFKKFVFSTQPSDGVVGLRNAWEEVRNVFSD